MKYILFLLTFINLSVVVQAGFKRVCYHTNWSQYREGDGKFVPEDIDPSVCTHLIYAFAKVDNGELKAFEWNDENIEGQIGNYEKFNDLKKTNPALKTLLAVGGWNAGTDAMTKMLATKSSRESFIKSTIKLLRKWKFDGFDLDFEYPAARGSPPEDKGRFTQLLEELRNAFVKEAKSSGQDTLLLTAAVAAGKVTIDKAYNIPMLNKYLDFINLMSYDFHGAWEKNTGFNAPLFSSSGDELTLDWSVRYWIKNGLSKEKLVIGLAMYGRCFELKDASESAVGAAAVGPCPAGAYTKEQGFYSYYEICTLLQTKSAKMTFSSLHQNPYLVDDKLWLGYDDERSLHEKLKYILDNGYGGWMVWDLSQDDFKGKFCPEKIKFPLLKSLNIDQSKPMSNVEDTAETSTSSTERAEDEPASSDGTTPGTPSQEEFGPDQGTDSEPLPEPESPTKPPVVESPLEEMEVTNEEEVNDRPDGPSDEQIGKTTTTAPTTDSYGGNPSTLSAHEADCSKFMQCSNGVKIEMKCPSSTYFSRNLSVCVGSASLSDERKTMCNLA